MSQMNVNQDEVENAKEEIMDALNPLKNYQDLAILGWYGKFSQNDMQIAIEQLESEGKIIRAVSNFLFWQTRIRKQ